MNTANMVQQSGFQFKQFYIEHGNVAMKVGTDGILLGSWVGSEKSKRILDIGTGSGLLAIMLAQQATNDCEIIGIDIDAAAVAQAIENAKQCPWPHKLGFQQAPLQQFIADEFDLIVSNPPYFASGQHFDSARQYARHDGQLTINDLFEHSARLLSANGQFACILPTDIATKAVDIAATFGLYCQQRLTVMTTLAKPAKRTLLLFSSTECSIIEQQLVIHQRSGEYSEDYIALCRDYYLHF
ncbi:methyltransferase [Alteromonadaceae bacterium BrNp21-10]|nr:methyltransferase [Alteromonadaceae bacterium BrNp21-10]